MQPTPPLSRAIRRLALTTKQANKGFYKGNRTGSMGRHTKHGGYVVEWSKVRTYVVPPEFKTFKVKPRAFPTTIFYHYILQVMEKQGNSPIIEGRRYFWGHFDIMLTSGYGCSLHRS